MQICWDAGIWECGCGRMRIFGYEGMRGDSSGACDMVVLGGLAPRSVRLLIVRRNDMCCSLF